MRSGKEAFQSLTERSLPLVTMQTARTADSAFGLLCRESGGNIITRRVSVAVAVPYSAASALRMHERRLAVQPQ